MNLEAIVQCMGAYCRRADHLAVEGREQGEEMQVSEPSVRLEQVIAALRATEGTTAVQLTHTCEELQRALEIIERLEKYCEQELGGQ